MAQDQPRNHLGQYKKKGQGDKELLLKIAVCLIALGMIPIVGMAYATLTTTPPAGEQPDTEVSVLVTDIKAEGLVATFNLSCNEEWMSWVVNESGESISHVLIGSPGENLVTALILNEEVDSFSVKVEVLGKVYTFQYKEPPVFSVTDVSIEGNMVTFNVTSNDHWKVWLENSSSYKISGTISGEPGENVKILLTTQEPINYIEVVMEVRGVQERFPSMSTGTIMVDNIERSGTLVTFNVTSPSNWTVWIENVSGERISDKLAVENEVSDIGYGLLINYEEPEVSVVIELNNGYSEKFHSP